MAQDVIVRIQGLNKTFRGRAGTVVALNGIDLDIYRGEIFGIIGLSGAGKSTLVRCINFLEKPTEGTVTVDGEELGRLSKKQLLEARRSMGMIFQQFNLLQQRTALQNICFPLEIAGTGKADAEKRARELLEIVGLSDRADNYPSQLSGGQQQRVAIARALATNPKILLCDEATSALDPTTTRSILALLKEINKTLGITIIVITHEMAVIEEICQRVAIIDSSRIAEVGTVDEVFTRPKSAMAKQLIYTAKNIKADEALRIGLVNAVYPAQELLPAAEKLAGTIAKNAPIAVRACKKAINDGLQVDMDRAVTIEEKLFGSCFETADQKEGMSAFLEKRKHEPYQNR